MQNPIAESARAALAQYADYREKQLLAAGDIESCFVSVISRLQRSTNRFLWFIRLRNVTVLVFLAWLAYSSGARGDLIVLICFAPFFLTMLTPESSALSKVRRSVTHLETIAELWLKYDRETPLSNELNNATHDEPFLLANA